MVKNSCFFDIYFRAVYFIMKQELLGRAGNDTDKELLERNEKRMEFLKKVFMCTLLAVAFGGVLAAGAVSVCHLQTDARETPLGIGMGQPEFR